MVHSVSEIPEADPKIFYSHNLHEITMYYPMRAVRTRRYKLIHNLFSNSPFPIDQDLYMSRAFQVRIIKSTVINNKICIIIVNQRELFNGPGLIGKPQLSTVALNPVTLFLKSYGYGTLVILTH